MNGRVYCPTTGRFLSPDNYVQAPDMTQSLNRFSYCLNNPLKYSDPTGNYALYDDLVAMAFGGLMNLGINALEGNIHNFGEAIGYFATGASAAETSIYLGPAAGAAVMGLGNNLTSQVSKNGWAGVDPWQLTSAMMTSVATSMLGAQFNSFLRPYTSEFSNAITDSPVIQKGIEDGISNSISGFALGTGQSLIDNPKDISGAFNNGLRSAGQGFGLGFMNGAIDGYSACNKNGINPWDGYKQDISTPNGWVAKSSNKSGGITFYNPENPDYSNMRVMPGNPNSNNLGQVGPYIKYQFNGRYYDRLGQVLSTGKCYEAHIPVNLFNIELMPRK